MLKIITVLGARPQFIKAAAVSRIINTSYLGLIKEIIVHTGQHYDSNMSKIFFDELEIPNPNYNLAISGGSHGSMTGRMLEAIEKVLKDEKPDWLMVYGDTNSTLSAALAAVKLHIPVAHVEAGLRSFNKKMPEEINRIICDRISSLHLCPTDISVANLAAEGISDSVYNVGDVMYDSTLYFQNISKKKSRIFDELNLSVGSFILSTCHRAENTDDPKRLTEIISSLRELAKKIRVIFPLHPRTRKKIHAYGLSTDLVGVTVVDPLSFFDMLSLIQGAKLILTDSGGIQKEAFFCKVPCLTMRDESEWTETISLGVNVLVGADKSRIIENFKKLQSGSWVCNFTTMPYGKGNASRKVVQKLFNRK